MTKVEVVASFREMLLDEILTEYLFLINDIRKDELEDIIVNQFDSI